MRAMWAGLLLGFVVGAGACDDEPTADVGVCEETYQCLVDECTELLGTDLSIGPYKEAYDACIESCTGRPPSDIQIEEYRCIEGQMGACPPELHAQNTFLFCGNDGIFCEEMLGECTGDPKPPVIGGMGDQCLSDRHCGGGLSCKGSSCQ